MKNMKRIILSIFALLAASVSPNLFPISQAGYALLSDLAVTYLIPSIIFLAVIVVLGFFIDEKRTSKQIITGIIAGLIATIGLEIIREIGFHLDGMPGDMPKLLGVLLLNQFAIGPDTTSNIAGWSFHFWNGASFGIIYSIIFGKGKTWMGTLYGIALGIGFMVSPAVIALGIGYFGVDFGWKFPVTVTLAHIVFGSILGWLLYKWNENKTSIFSTLKNLYVEMLANKNVTD